MQQQQQNALPVRDMNSYANQQQQQLTFADRSQYNKAQQQPQQQSYANNGYIQNSSSSSSNVQQQQQPQQPEQIQGGLGIVERMHNKAYIATRRYAVEIFGSPYQFAGGIRSPSCPLGSTHAIQYRKDKVRGSKRSGNVKQGIVLAGKIVQMTNTYDFPIMLCCDQLRSNLYTNDPKQRGIVYIGAGKTVRNVAFYHPDTRIYSPIMQTYGNLKKSDLVAQEIMLDHTGTPEPYHAVPIGSKLATVIWRNSTNQDPSNGTYDIGPTNKFTVIEDAQTKKLWTPKVIFEKAVGALHTKVIKQMPYINMSGITFYIVRPNCGWLKTRTLSKYSSENITKVLSSSGAVYGSVQLDYRLVGHGSFVSY
jgi:hypothetical protein